MYRTVRIDSLFCFDSGWYGSPIPKLRPGDKQYTSTARQFVPRPRSPNLNTARKWGGRRMETSGRATTSWWRFTNNQDLGRTYRVAAHGSFPLFSHRFEDFADTQDIGSSNGLRQPRHCYGDGIELALSACIWLW